MLNQVTTSSCSFLQEGVHQQGKSGDVYLCSWYLVQLHMIPHAWGTMSNTSRLYILYPSLLMVRDTALRPLEHFLTKVYCI